MGGDPTGNTEALLLVLVWMEAMVLVVLPSGEVT